MKPGVSDDSLEKLREHQEDLADIAESDLPANWIAAKLLEVLEEHDN